MLESLYQQLITTATGLLLLGGSWLTLFLTGVAKYMFNNKKWSWKKTFESIVKAVLMCVATLAWVAVMNGVSWFAGKCGADITAIMDGMSVAGVCAGIIGGSAFFLMKAYKNILNFVNTQHVEVEVSDPDYAGISKSISSLIGSMFVHDDGDGEEHDENSLPEYGAWPYYRVGVSTPEEFYAAVNGKSFDEGWGAQCVAGFKEFCYSLSGKTVSTAAGAAKDYANQGAQIESLGFKRFTDRNLQNGDWVIFGMGRYGHVAMYYNGRFFGQNQLGDGSGHPFNLVGVSLDSYLCHYRPNIYVKASTLTPAPDPSPTPAPSPIKAGDSVYAWGRGTATSLGTGQKTKEFARTKMKVIMIINGRYALNQYNQGVVGNAGAVTGWWPAAQVEKA